MWKQVFFSSLLSIGGAISAQAQIAEHEPLPPLDEIINGREADIDANTLFSRFEEICDAYGSKAMTQALSAFKEPKTLKKAQAAIPDENYYKRFFRFRLADLFWEGQCVHPDRDFTHSIYNGLAFTMGYSMAKESAMRAHARALEQLQAKDPEAFASSSRPLWDAQMHLLYDAQRFSPPLLEVPVLDAEEIAAIDNDSRLATTPFSRDIPPAQQEAAILRQILDLGQDAPFSVAYSLKAGKFDHPLANSLALVWLALAREPPFENPMVVHTMALWLRDKEFRKRRVAEYYVPDQKDRDLRAANDSLKYALLMEDTSLVPLAYCLLDEQFFNKKFSAAAKPAYALLLWLKENGWPYSEEKLQTLEDELSFFERWGLDGKSIIEIDENLLPADDVDLTECALETGQTEFWKAEGLL